MSSPFDSVLPSSRYLSVSIFVVIWCRPFWRHSATTTALRSLSGLSSFSISVQCFSCHRFSLWHIHLHPALSCSFRRRCRRPFGPGHSIHLSGPFRPHFSHSGHFGSILATSVHLGHPYRSRLLSGRRPYSAIIIVVPTTL